VFSNFAFGFIEIPKQSFLYVHLTTLTSFFVAQKQFFLRRCRRDFGQANLPMILLLQEMRILGKAGF
jgi:hypothetical protein